MPPLLLFLNFLVLSTYAVPALVTSGTTKATVPAFPPPGYTFPVQSCPKQVTALPEFTVQVSTGFYTGQVWYKNRIEWRGIPYAAPPTDYTSAAANPIPGCSRHAANVSNIQCVQQNGQGQTDCLVLNVAAPLATGPGDNLPVLFWVHGGSFVNGNGLQQNFQQFTVDSKIVAVSVNYRLQGCSVGECMTDVTKNEKALEWVHNNIIYFGGNPKQVTVVGLSAGAGLLTTLLWLPSPAAAYFQKAAFYSGFIAEYQIDLQEDLYLVPTIFSVAKDVKTPVTKHEVAISRKLAAKGIVSYHIKNLLGGDGSDLGALFSGSLYHKALADFVMGKPNLYLAPFSSGLYSQYDKTGAFQNFTIPAI
ncbi:hypothetical protein HDU99_004124 [Rhizoclosmatium hyalinum]|nr:hypothetical protein HDU99_004124 [Rhizoclosmatium hyalinum]